MDNKLFFLIAILVGYASSYDKITNSLLKLEKYGYLSAGKPGSGSLQSTDAIGNFQAYAGLKVTKQLDEATVAKLNEPRCGMKDPSSPNRAKRYVHQGTKWHKKKLTYKIITYSRYSRLSRADVRRTVRATLDKWMAVTNLDFTETSSDDADIRIRFVRRRHGDPYEFDGRGGTLAHAFYPSNNIGLAGDAHFDDDEIFTLRSPSGTNFYWVALHEFGHSIGLEHSNKLGAVMYPWYQGYKGDDAKLTYDDVIGIQHLYGARSKKPVPTKSIKTEKPAPRPVTPKEKAKPCFNRIKAVILGRDDKTLVINDDRVYVLGKYLKVEREPYQLDKFFPGLTRIDTATTMDNGDTIFFHGDQFWIFQGKTLRTGPLPITRYGLHKDMNNLDAVLTWPGTSKQYFFKGDRFWRFDFMKRKIDPKYPKSMKAWKGIPSQIDSVFQWRNKAMYFFKGEMFYRFDSRRIKAVPGYPKRIQGDFVICPSETNQAALNSKLTSDPGISKTSAASSGNRSKESFLTLSVIFCTVFIGLLRNI